MPPPNTGSAPPQAPHQPYFQPPPQQSYQKSSPQRVIAPQAVSSMVQPPTKSSQLNTDDVAIAKAQKHARWAISALNFEDAETAVRELRDALKTLGAA